MIKPKRIMPGSRIGIISPSSGLPHLFPDTYELGLKNLEEVMGFEVVEMPTARMAPDDLYNLNSRPNYTYTGSLTAKAL